MKTPRKPVQLEFQEFKKKEQLQFRGEGFREKPIRKIKPRNVGPIRRLPSNPAAYKLLEREFANDLYPYKDGTIFRTQIHTKNRLIELDLAISEGETRKLLWYNNKINEWISVKENSETIMRILLSKHPKKN